MIAALQHSLDWINAHPDWALLMLLIASLLDSVVIIGAFVPAGVALFAGGALVALGSLELWQAISICAGGAVIGDSFSFWLGRRYGEWLFSRKLLQRYPELLLNGRRFFARYGAYGIALARFLGPMRAIVPSLAGASQLRVVSFLIADISSATLWAFAFVLPGVAFGASLGLAAEVAGRLALLLLGTLVAIVVAAWMTAAVSRATQRHAEAWIGSMLDWSRRHRRLGKFGASLADPDQPETPVLALLAMVLLAISGLWLWLGAGPTLHPHPTTLDAALFQSMRDLHSPWGLAIAQRLLQLGHWKVYGPLALMTFACLVLLRKPRAAAHWLAALGFGALLSLGLYAIPTVPPPSVMFGIVSVNHLAPSDFVLAPVIYSFLPVLLSTGRKAQLRGALYGTAVTILILILLARMYVGEQWSTVALFSVVVGALWSALLGLGYRRHRAEALPARRVLIPVAGAFLISVAFAWSTPQPPAHIPSQAVHTTTLSWWQQDAWRELPHSRIDVAGRTKQTLNLQWAGSLQQITQSLKAAGWEHPPLANGSNVLRWLGRDTPIASLPILPQLHAGHHPALTLIRIRDTSHAELLRLWPSGLRLADGRPIWLGTVNGVAAHTLYRLFRYPIAVGSNPDVATLLGDVDGLRMEPRQDRWLLSFAPAKPSESQGSAR